MGNLNFRIIPQLFIISFKVTGVAGGLIIYNKTTKFKGGFLL